MKTTKFIFSIILVSALSIANCNVAAAQEYGDSVAMTLNECLEFAKINSITLQKAQLEVDNSQADILSSKGAFLPTLSGSISQNVSINPFDETYGQNSGQYNGSYGIDLALNIYNGGKNKANLEKSNINETIANLGLDEFANSLEVSVTEVYVQILYAIEQIEVAKTSLEISQKNQARGKAFLVAGSINEVDYAQLESSTATYQYNLVVAKADLNNLYVSLKHLLEISQQINIKVTPTELESDLANISISTVETVYQAALEQRPEIASSNLYIATAELDTKIAKAGYLPTVSLTAGTGISHSSSSSYDFSSQLRDNFTTSAGLKVSVPIFSGYQNKTAVQKAENNEKTAGLNLVETQKDLYQTIETLYNNAITAQAKYNVSTVQLDATQKSMELTTKQYELGLKNTIELLTEQDNYNQALQDLLVNKYQFLYNNAILNFYQSNTINL